MSITPTKATARVTVTLEIELTSKWGADCTVGQVQAQAQAEVEGILHRAFAPRENHEGLKYHPPKVGVHSPKVTMIVLPEDRP